MNAAPVGFSPEVAAALESGRPVVALESSVLAQGLPRPFNREAATEMSAAIRSVGAVPAITAVIRGRASVGVTDPELNLLLSGDGIRKVSARDIAVAIVRGDTAATTVAGTLALIQRTGIEVFATGGIGGVHRGSPFDESADLAELARNPRIVVCSGAKSILDLAATVERLESLGVAVVGYRTDEFPAFFARSSGLAVSTTVESAEEVVALFAAQRSLGRSAAVIVAQPPPADHALPGDLIQGAVSRALEEMREAEISGPAVTPFLLAAVERATGGRSLATNVALLSANASLAAEIAVCLTSRR
ncbi:MAG: pseudouridine-5'-phosphate glycosidase [Gemmatimonadota bacterium]